MRGHISKRYKNSNGHGDEYRRLIGRTLAAHGQVEIADCAILAKDLVQMVLVDRLGQLLDNDLSSSACWSQVGTSY